MRRSAKEWGKRLAETPEFAFRRRYGLAPSDPRYLRVTMAEILVDLWAHRYADDPGLRDAVEMDPEDMEAELAAMEAAATAPANGEGEVVERMDFGGGA